MQQYENISVSYGKIAGFLRRFAADCASAVVKALSITGVGDFMAGF